MTIYNLHDADIRKTTQPHPGGIHFDYRVQQEYIITEDMLRYWKNQCVAEPAHTNTDECKACQYRGKGTREGCCDFDDTDMEKIFRSRPHTSTPQSYINETKGMTENEYDQWMIKHDAVIRTEERSKILRLVESDEWQKEHDEQTRNATLDEFMQAIEFRFDDTNRGRGVVGTIRGIKESLREQP